MVARTGRSREQTRCSGEHSTAVGALLARSKYDHAAGDMRAAMPSGDHPDSMLFLRWYVRHTDDSALSTYGLQLTL